MATCSMREDKALIVHLDAVELETVGMHGKREALSVTDAMADLVEYVIGRKCCEICQEESDAISCQSEKARIVGLDVRFPKVGPLSLLTDDEKEVVYARIMSALGDAVTMLLIKHSSGGN